MARSHALVTAFLVAALLTVIHGGAAAAIPTDPTFAADLLPFEDRVRYQRQIEEVYWRHRIWPAENPGPKPTLDEVLPETVIRERVATYLEKSAALEVVWQRPLTGEQLQAEMDRMVRGTKKPDLLRELFETLDNDPLVIAECLARPLLVDRLTRNWYARDARFHGAVRAVAEAALARHANETAAMQDLGGDYRELGWRLASKERWEHAYVDLEAEKWREQIGLLARSFGVERGPEAPDDPSALLETIPLRSLSPLAEENDRFVITSVLSRGRDSVRIATVTWNKRPFDHWWAEEGRAAVASVDDLVRVYAPLGGYELPSLLDTGCVADSWSPLWYVPVGFSGHTVVWTGTEMIVWGGGGPGYAHAGGRYDPATDSWAPTSMEGVPSERVAHSAVWTGTEMIVWGGTKGGEYPITGGRYDPFTDSWTPTSTTSAASPRGSHTAVWTGTEMVVWGGHHYYEVPGSGGYLEYYSVPFGRLYDPATDSWSQMEHQGSPSARGNHTAVWAGTEMIVWGGYGYVGNNEIEYSGTGGRYEPGTDSWTATSDATGAPTARSGHTAVWTGTEMIVWGGYDGVGRLNTGGRYDPGTDDWSATSSGTGAPTARSSHTAVWTGAEMVVFGGYDGDYLGTGGRYDPVTDSWATTSTGTGWPGPRRGHSAIWTGSEMIVWGGLNFVDGAAFYLSTGGRYDPGTDSWTATSTGAGVPRGSEGQTAVWTGAEMIVWGGLGGFQTYLNTGGRYDPATDGWTPTSIGAGVPTGRELHTAVWTGTKMIVWGGFSRDAGYYTNTGGQYDPTADSWMATSTREGTLGSRGNHSAVWTGTEMIVWGGIDYAPVGWMNTGERYNPATDSWTATSTGAGVPEARDKHTAVWTGTEMIVWGGHTGLPPDTGGRYDPVTDSWTATSTGAGAPAGRYDHTAVWTGAEMIVWGGNPSGTPLNTGGRYDPATDSWSATSTGAEVPTIRDNHTAVWTGAEMIVWGGYGGGYLGTGGRYDPATDSWAATSAGAGVPTDREYHTAVWTGTEMIVWGGSGDGGDYVTNGGLYCACDGETVSIWYPDMDGDGYGCDSTGIPSCTQPPGYIAVGGDCDDTNPGAHTGTTEVNDGLDNSCPGDLGHGLVDEIDGVCGFHNLVDADEFSCPLQPGATRYEVARSPHPEFPSWVGCLRIVSDAATWVDSDPVPEGTCFYYLVRSHEPHPGSWGADSAGIERTVTCHR